MNWMAIVWCLVGANAIMALSLGRSGPSARWWRAVDVYLLAIAMYGLATKL